MVVIFPPIIEPVIEPSSKSSPCNVPSIILLPLTEFNEKSPNVIPEFANLLAPIVLSGIKLSVIAPSAILSVVTAPFTK